MVHRATLHEQTERQVQFLAALHSIDLAISSSFDLRVTLGVLETLAGQAAIAIDNAKLFEDLQCSNIELFHSYEATI